MELVTPQLCPHSSSTSSSQGNGVSVSPHQTEDRIYLFLSTRSAPSPGSAHSRCSVNAGGGMRGSCRAVCVWEAASAPFRATRFDEQVATHHFFKELVTWPHHWRSSTSLVPWTPPASARLSPSPLPVHCLLDLNVWEQAGVIVHRMNIHGLFYGTGLCSDQNA